MLAANSPPSPPSPASPPSNTVSMEKTGDHYKSQAQCLQLIDRVNIFIFFYASCIYEVKTLYCTIVGYFTGDFLVHQKGCLIRPATETHIQHNSNKEATVLFHLRIILDDKEENNKIGLIISKT